MRVLVRLLWARTVALTAKWPSPRDIWTEGSRSRPASVNYRPSNAATGLIDCGSGSMCREVCYADGRSSGSEQPGFILSVLVDFWCGMVDLGGKGSQNAHSVAFLSALAPRIVRKVYRNCSTWLTGRAWLVFCLGTILLPARARSWKNCCVCSLARLPQCSIDNVEWATCREIDRGAPAGGGVREPGLWPLDLNPLTPQKAPARHSNEEEGAAEGGPWLVRSGVILPLVSGTPAFWITQFTSSRCALKNASTMTGRATQQLHFHLRLPGSSNLSLWRPRVKWRDTLLAQVVEAQHFSIQTPALLNSQAARWWRNLMATSSRHQWRRHPALTPEHAAWTSRGLTACHWYKSVFVHVSFLSESVMYLSVMALSL